MHNTKEGIATQINSYAAFYAVMRLRNERGHYKTDGTPGEEHARLTPFTVLGRYRSDEFGQCGRLHRELFTDADRAAMPPVMTDEEFRGFFDQYVRPRITESFYSTHEGISGMSPAFPLPPPHIVCARCGGTWALDTCHDIDAEGDFEDIDLAQFTGKTLREVEIELSARTDALRAFGHPLHVQNPQWVDSNANEQWATPEQRGWRDVAWDYVVQHGDRSSVFCFHFYHGQCFRELNGGRAAVEEAENVEGMKQMLEEVGFGDVRMTLMPLPDHVRKWIAADLDEGESVDEAAEALTYYRAETLQGAFGIVCYAAHAMLIDLEGSGVSFCDLEPQVADLVPAHFPSIVNPTPEQFLRLWQFMKQRAGGK